MMSHDSFNTEKILFIDSSHILQYGLINEDLSWLEFNRVESLKSSSLIHKLLFDMLKRHELSAKDFKTLIVSGGPGSFTGVRLSEGLGQIFNMKGTKIVTFFHFEIPVWVGTSKGHWISNAHKDEFFVHTWDGEEFNQDLVTKDKLYSLQFSDIYSFESDLKGIATKSSLDMIKDHPKEIFKHILKRGEHFSPFYYRKLDEEFAKKRKEK